MEIEQTAAGNPWGLAPPLDVKELARYLHVPVSTVYDWRTRGFGPRGYRFGKHLKFAVSDVRDWIGSSTTRLFRRERSDSVSAPRLSIGTFGDVGLVASGTGRTGRPRSPAA